MTRYSPLVLCVFATLCIHVGFAQVMSPNVGARIGSPASASPAAFVYVSSSPSANNYEIDAFAADSSGRLTSMAGSPFATDVQSMAVNGQYLFGANGIDIRSFSVAPDGGLQQV